MQGRIWLIKLPQGQVIMNLVRDLNCKENRFEIEFQNFAILRIQKIINIYLFGFLFIFDYHTINVHFIIQFDDT